MNNVRRKSEGFTIIEVLIVLAIAGLIMLIVFLAIPALQRNQRNNARNSDVGRVVSSISEWYSNNNGQQITAANSVAARDAIIQSVGTLSQYTLTTAGAVGANSFTYATGTQSALVAGTNNVNLGSIQLVTSATCGASGATTVNTSARRTVVQYLLESGGGVTAVCKEV